MKKKSRFTFSQVLHNSKAMMVFSLLAAVAVWVGVTLGPTNVQQRTFTVQVNLRTESPNQIANLRILEHDKPVSVTVTVEGPISVVSRLTENAFSIVPDYASIIGEGTHPVDFSVRKSGVDQNYDIVEILPRSIDVSCVMWNSGRELPLEIDTSAVTVAETVKGNHEIGTVSFVSAALRESDRVTVEGPQSVVNKIDRLVAKVESSSLTAEAELSAAVTALDAEGKALALERCTVSKTENMQVAVRVSLAFTKKVTLKHTIKNLPPSQAERENFVTLEPAELFLVGEESAVEAYAAQIEHLPPVDIGSISEKSDATTYILPPSPNGVTSVSADRVIYRFAMENYRGRDVDFTVEGVASEQIEFINAAPETTVAAVKTDLVVHLVGPTDAALRAVTAKNLKITIDLAERTWAGECTARITVTNRRDVWVYSGENGEFKVFVDIITGER